MLHTFDIKWICRVVILVGSFIVKHCQNYFQINCVCYYLETYVLVIVVCNILFQFEAYRIEKAARNIKEAAKCFSAMWVLSLNTELCIWFDFAIIVIVIVIVIAYFHPSQNLYRTHNHNLYINNCSYESSYLSLVYQCVNSALDSICSLFENKSSYHKQWPFPWWRIIRQIFLYRIEGLLQWK
jgi:hypothetical protein